MNMLKNIQKKIPKKENSSSQDDNQIDTVKLSNIITEIDGSCSKDSPTVSSSDSFLDTPSSTPSSSPSSSMSSLDSYAENLMKGFVEDNVDPLMSGFQDDEINKVMTNKILEEIMPGFKEDDDEEADQEAQQETMITLNDEIIVKKFEKYDVQIESSIIDQIKSYLTALPETCKRCSGGICPMLFGREKKIGGNKTRKNKKHRKKSTKKYNKKHHKKHHKKHTKKRNKKRKTKRRCR